jgi:para-aminobenzoate synthetase
MTTLLIDNYDSYTYNIFHLLAAASGEEPIVLHNDAVSWRALERWDFDAIVLSPGPGRPDRWHDFGVCADILRSSVVPVLGVCLGHQGLGQVLNADVTTAPLAMHGRLSKVEHVGSGLFARIPQDFSAVRYHSLAVTGSLGDEGRVIAWTDDDVVMAIEHTRLPKWGVQFHPESIATEHGRRLFENFYALAAERRPARRRHMNKPGAPPRRVRERNTDSGWSLTVRTIEGEPSTDLLFERLFGEHEHAFWLDSADAPSPLAQSSYMGSTIGPNRCVLEYDVEHGLVSTHRAGESTTEHGSIFDVLDRELQSRAIEPPPELASRSSIGGLLGGFVGYLGYECKADCGSSNAHRSDLPDAVLMFANRIVAVDHVDHRTTLLAVCNGDDEQDAERWLSEAEKVVHEAAGAGGRASDPLTADADTDVAAFPDAADLETNADADASTVPSPVVFRCGRGREQYLADIARCQSALAAGESYEVCLTDQIHSDASPDPWELYRLLRRENPAPFAAYLKLGELSILSSSPERFLSVDRDHNVQARPIKGTAPRSDNPGRDEALRAGLLDDEKTFAEHLMIVDLMRNDLGRVCVLDSVRVPDFMVVESYATVHQLISNITGTLEPARSPVDCVRACFPGGSMTGAPKLRTMELIDDIEREARGVYSGALGYFGLDGSVDLSIVIRTIVMGPGATTIGAGGAIVTQSDPQEEFDELLLKARAPIAAIAQAVTGSDAPDAWAVELEPEAVAAGTR